MYETFEHTADLGLRVRADSLAQLFADAAKGLFAVLVTNLGAVRSVQEKTYSIAGHEIDYLLLDWLTELLYTFESEQLMLAEFDVQVDAEGLQATCRGEPIDRQRHALAHEIKAITYHGLKVEPTPAGWLAELIVDI